MAMDMHMMTGISLLLLFFFSGLATAFKLADRLRLELNRKSHPLRYGLVHLITRDRGLFNSTVVTGFTISLATLGISVTLFARESMASQNMPAWITLILWIAGTFLLAFLFGELLPKRVFTLSPNGLLTFLAYPLSLIFVLLYPLTGLLVMMVRSFTPRKKHTPGEDDVSSFFSRSDLDHLVAEEISGQAEQNGSIDKEVILFRNALDFSKVKLREIMVPRNEISVLDINSGVETLRQKFVETGFSRILFYEGNKDNIVGYVHTSAIFQKAREIKPFLKNVLIVPETMAANRLLSRFIHEHRSIALVVDEFGGTAGLVTSEDILEEIFGEIEDEHDTNDFSGRRINDRSFILPGRQEIDDLNEEYKLNIPDSDQYETLAGFILYHHESIPRVNSVVTIGNMTFKILKATLTRIEMVHLTINDN